MSLQSPPEPSLLTAPGAWQGQKACTSVRSLLGRMAKSGRRQQLFNTELYLRDTESQEIRHMVCLLSHMARGTMTETKHILPLFIKFLPKENVVPQSGIENPGLLGHISKGPTDGNAALQKRHLGRQTSSSDVNRNITLNQHTAPTLSMETNAV